MQNKMNPVHPGEILKEELQERGLSATALARALEVPPNRITSIVNEQRSVTPETAILLSRFFNSSPEFWLNLQQTWELRQAENRFEQEQRVASR
ncbi:MAG: HigA family addiction module antidote protein [Gammaproteobacteria bacterium]|nr:HigA family addiction module antidote protein [Gammaproteobacteria bacterium]MYF01764.1 HigA family addiction module antidote protein [Gammaproteobacteria bacterium]MYI77820.1 HigA family addiction module antidote protein [Gammaproteobacteria bacterium]